MVLTWSCMAGFLAGLDQSWSGNYRLIRFAGRSAIAFRASRPGLRISPFAENAGLHRASALKLPRAQRVPRSPRSRPRTESCHSLLSRGSLACDGSGQGRAICARRRGALTGRGGGHTLGLRGNGSAAAILDTQRCYLPWTPPYRAVSPTNCATEPYILRTETLP